MSLISINDLTDLTEDEREAIAAYTQVAGRYAKGVQGLVEDLACGELAATLFGERNPFSLYRQRVLDIGCGPGWLCGIAEKRGVDYVGIDPSEGMISTARRLYPKGDFHLLDAAKIPIAFASGSFDAFFASNSLSFIPPDKLGKVLQGIRCVLKEGAQGIVVLVSGDCAWEERPVLVDDEGTLFVREYFWEPGALMTQFRDAGFKVESLREIPLFMLLQVTR